MHKRVILLFCGLILLCVIGERLYHKHFANIAPIKSVYEIQRSIPSPLRRWSLYAEAGTVADVWWRENRLEFPAEAEILQRMASVPTAYWVTLQGAEAEKKVGAYLEQATRVGQLPVLVIYYIVGRDAGGYSRGGAASADEYRHFIRRMNRVIGTSPILLIVEPDALAHLPGLSERERTQRITLLQDAVLQLSRINRFVYLDAGHAGWLSAGMVADLLRQCGIDKAQGFSLNISNFRTVEETTPYAVDISRRIGGTKGAVIDTSRCGNGPGSRDDWCNPSGRSLGPEPTTQTLAPIDALLWVKHPWESDGDCNNAPSAGQLHLLYTLQLAKNAGWPK